MRVIAGNSRGLNLYSLDSSTTRPTLDRVKETLFNVINYDVNGANCLDVFAGSGALSIEAVSRNANHAYMIEKDIDAINIIEMNIKKAKYEDKCTLFKGDFKEELLKISKLDVKFSIVFVDPPYESAFYTEVLDRLFEYNMLNDDAIIVLEHKKDENISHDKFEKFKEKTFSKNQLSFYELKESV